MDILETFRMHRATVAVLVYNAPYRALIITPR